MKNIALLLLAAVGLTLPNTTQAEPKDEKKHRVVIEVMSDSKESWEATLNNVENLQKAFGAPEVQIEVVAHGKGLGLLLKASEAGERTTKIAGMGVVFAACQNTMHKKHVTKDDLLPVATTVDSGVTEVVRKQEAGWAYLKGGG